MALRLSPWRTVTGVPPFAVQPAGPEAVCVAPMTVKDAFDSKYKTSLPKVMREALTKAVDRSSKLTTKAPSSKDKEGFYLDGGLTLDGFPRLVRIERADGGLIRVLGGPLRLAPLVTGRAAPALAA